MCMYMYMDKGDSECGYPSCLNEYMSTQLLFSYLVIRHNMFKY